MLLIYNYNLYQLIRY